VPKPRTKHAGARRRAEGEGEKGRRGLVLAMVARYGQGTAWTSVEDGCSKGWVLSRALGGRRGAHCVLGCVHVSWSPLGLVPCSEPGVNWAVLEWHGWVSGSYLWRLAAQLAQMGPLCRASAHAWDRIPCVRSTEVMDRKGRLESSYDFTGEFCHMRHVDSPDVDSQVARAQPVPCRQRCSQEARPLWAPQVIRKESP